VRPAILAALTVAALGLPAAAFPQAAAPPAEVLTVEEAVALALQNNRRVASAAMDVQRAEARVDAYRTYRLPSFDLQANAGTMLNALSMTFPGGAFGTFPDIGPIPAVDTVVDVPRSLSGYVSATVAQPLTQLRRIGLGTKLQEISRDGEKQKLRSERAGVAAETRRLYYALLQGQAALAAADDQVKVFQEMSRVVAEHMAEESALPADALDIKARLASAEYAPARARNDLATRKEQMNHLLGRDLMHHFTVAEIAQPSAAETDLETALSSAVARRPDLAQARLAVEQADTDQRLKKAESIPDVSVAFTYTSFVNVDLMPTKFAQLGLQLKWEPFDWGRKGKERAEKALQLLQAQSTARETESGARMEVAQTFRRLREAQLFLDAARLAREASHEKLRTMTNRYQEEAALLRELLEAQASASSADARWTEALMTFWMIRADFRKALGEDE
jgi:outer membrane protein TolC